MIDWTKSTLVLRGSCGWTMALLTWDELVGLNGGFSGRAVASGAVARWELESPSGGTLGGAYHVPWEQVSAGRGVDVDWQTVERWAQEAKAVKDPSTKGPPAFDCHLRLAPLPSLPPMPTLVRACDLSPLANLATAVAWGLALERVVTEWHAWHPAARVTWDIRNQLRLHLAFSVDGIGEVYAESIPLVGCGAERLPYAAEYAQTPAALAMAPHYVAPKAKPVNRDAALRRFADGVRT